MGCSFRASTKTLRGILAFDLAAQGACRNHRGRTRECADSMTLAPPLAAPNQVILLCLFLHRPCLTAKGSNYLPSLSGDRTVPSRPVKSPPGPIIFPSGDAQTSALEAIFTRSVSPLSFHDLTMSIRQRFEIVEQGIAHSDALLLVSAKIAAAGGDSLQSRMRKKHTS